MTQSNITFIRGDGLEVMRLTRDGIWANPDVAIDDTAKVVLDVLDVQIKRLVQKAVEAEREACAKVCEEKQTYSMSIPCPDGISGCCVNHFVPARREKTGTECAAAIRARGET